MGLGGFAAGAGMGMRRWEPRCSLQNHGRTARSCWKNGNIGAGRGRRERSGGAASSRQENLGSRADPELPHQQGSDPSPRLPPQNSIGNSGNPGSGSGVPRGYSLGGGRSPPRAEPRVLLAPFGHPLPSPWLSRGTKAAGEFPFLGIRGNFQIFHTPGLSRGLNTRL